MGGPSPPLWVGMGERKPLPSPSSVFSMKLLVTLQCTSPSCRFTRTRVEDMNDISVDIAENAKVEDCVKEYFKPDRVEVKCDKCGGSSSEKTMAIEEKPRCLMLHLKRFRAGDKGAVRKGCERVTFGKVLDIGGVCKEVKGVVGSAAEQGTGGGGGDRYTLKGIVRHVGTADSRGHYVTDAVDKEGRWVNYNDERAEVRTEEEVFGGERAGREAYLMVYERE